VKLAAYLASLFGDEQVGAHLADALRSEHARRCTDRNSLLSFLTIQAPSLSLAQRIEVVKLLMEEL
jgi:hypothetical protein